ncbi:hypothetical protein REJC140_01741 [Pseudorhizobium endolithicum]|uniref:Uncharacterized protein n=1 Tax=Pseudorhizobium endolithicum TaxID=1191678 RepID=A0ABM8PW05_9HYPH|nr:hypothetical protein [Pseudorhizobium endolithicum]CAD7051539.1 hypothetical protein REJC140_01741 [Pseudorhizobium endolithicum]
MNERKDGMPSDSSAHLIQILLPAADPDGRPFPPELFASVRDNLAQRFGGITFHRSAPAEGLWLGKGGIERDAIVIAEVMVETLDHHWWRSYRSDLETIFRQDEIVVRALPITRL